MQKTRVTVTYYEGGKAATVAVEYFEDGVRFRQHVTPEVPFGDELVALALREASYAYGRPTPLPFE